MDGRTNRRTVVEQPTPLRPTPWMTVVVKGVACFRSTDKDEIQGHVVSEMSLQTYEETETKKTETERQRWEKQKQEKIWVFLEGQVRITPRRSSSS